jgi:hypothetical protein
MIIFPLNKFIINFFVINLFLLLAFFNLYGQNVFINKFSQGTGSGTPCSPLSEWVQIVTTATVNLTGYEIRDGNQNDLLFKFSNHPFLASVPPGYVIVVYNGTASPGCVKDVTPDLNTNDCNFTLVIPHNDPNFASPLGTWSSTNAFANGTNTDGPRLINSSNTVVHDWDQGNNPGFTAIYPGTGEAVVYNGTTAAGIINPSNWQKVFASPAISQPTTVATWITNLRPVLNPTAQNSGPVCSGQSVTLTATGGGNYTWSGPSGFTGNTATVTRNPAVAGVYTVTVTDANGCVATATTSVTVNPLPTPTVNNNGPICVGQTLQLTGGGGGTYSWSGPNGFSSALQNPSLSNATAAAAGVYTLTVTSGCRLRRLRLLRPLRSILCQVLRRTITDRFA